MAYVVNMGTGEVLTQSPTPYQLMPGLTDEERASLRLDIEKHGIRVPIDVDEEDNILDGHHRAWIAAELGIPCPRRLVAGLSEAQKRAHAVSVNVFRRNLTREQRKELVVRLRSEGMSNRRIAGAVGVAEGTVRNDLAGSGAQDCAPETVVGDDGKNYPASRPKSTVARDLSGVPSGTPEPPAGVDPETGEITASSSSGDSEPSPSGDTPEAAGSGDDEQEIVTPAPSPAPNPAPRTLTAEEQAEDDRKGQIRRAAVRLEELVTGWLELPGLRQHRYRDEVLALLNEHDRSSVLEIEAIYERGVK